MKTVARDRIEQAIDAEAAVAAIEQAYRDHSTGRIISLPVSHMRFDDPPGDIHVKGAHIEDARHFAVKIASSFYDNPGRGLPSSDGIMMLFDRATGRPELLLDDRGWLTDLRTAIGGAIAARLIAPAAPRTLGIVGTGTQAALQARWISRLLDMERILIWGRDTAKSEAMAASLGADNIDVRTEATLDALVAEADIVITTTPAREPIITAEMARPGLRIVAVGADAPGKREIDRRLVGAANLVLVDARDQCAAYGECADGAASPDRMIEIGEALLPGGMPHLSDEVIAIADLTGIGAQDAAIAAVAGARLMREE